MFIPINYNEAIHEIIRILVLEDEVKLLFEPTDQYSAMARQFFGMGIRNEWGLWKGSNACPVEEAPLYYDLYRRGLRHPDDMYGFIMEGARLAYEGLPFAEDLEIEFYQNYWKRMHNEQLEGIRRVVENVIDRNMKEYAHERAQLIASFRIEKITHNPYE